jgi:3-isopropylmalate dehydrogenase
MNSEVQAPLARSPSGTTGRFLVGTLKGEGVGAEVIAIALHVGRVAAQRFGFELQVETGGVIGLESKKQHEAELSPGVIGFCSEVFAAGGAILSGPGGGRYVYDLRRQFRLFCKVNPLSSFPVLAGASRLKAPAGEPVDILLVRENLEGLYQGETTQLPDKTSRGLAHTFYCTESNVRRLLERACRFAAGRSRHLTVIVKRGALPEISALWEDCASEVAKQQAVQYELMDIDFAAYQLLQAPAGFDVIASPNCFGDILADLGGLFFGSRGLTYGASYSAEGFGVYQTNHGSAYDLAGKNRANPVGQIFSLAMLLRESFHLPEAANAIIRAVQSVWTQGWRTADLMERGSRLIGTDTFAEKIVEAIRTQKRSPDA